MSIVKKTSIFLTALILLLSLCFSCKFTQKESIQTDTLQVDYYIRYLQSDKQLKAEISFAQVDSTKKIMPKKMAEVLFQDKVLTGKKLLKQYRYELITQTTEHENYRLIYRLDGQSPNTHNIALAPILNFSVKKDKVSLTAGTTLNLEGQPLQGNERIILLISDENNKTSTLKIDHLSTKMTVEIKPEQVKELTLGAATIYLVRKQRIEQNNNNIHITGTTEYYTVVKAIEIIQ